MITYKKLRESGIDLGPVGIEARDHYERYYCTPVGAKIIGAAGVDGIHYCTVRGFGSMIFAVSPMNFGDCVHPIARSLDDLLRMLLYCGDMAALEQCYAWDEEQFKAFLCDYPPDEAQKAVLGNIRQKFGLEPMENTFEYVRTLQAGFDLSLIPYSEEYYDSDMNPAVPAQYFDEENAEWTVCYGKGFGKGEEETGREIRVDRTFSWNSVEWLIPSVYLFRRGIVVDFAAKLEAADVENFIFENHLERGADGCDEMTGERLMRDDPTNISFHSYAECGGERLFCEHSSRIQYFPDTYMLGVYKVGSEARAAVEHYGLSGENVWIFTRCSYRCYNAEELTEQDVSLSLMCSSQPYSCPKTVIRDSGEEQIIIHPVSGSEIRLCVKSYEWKNIPQAAFNDGRMEYPSMCRIMGYTLEPDMPVGEFMLRDVSGGDRPRRKASEDGGAGRQDDFVMSAAAAVIGGADGPCAVFASPAAFTADGQSGNGALHSVCSSLYFEAGDEIEWQPVFMIKTGEDCTVSLFTKSR